MRYKTGEVSVIKDGCLLNSSQILGNGLQGSETFALIVLAGAVYSQAFSSYFISLDLVGTTF